MLLEELLAMECELSFKYRGRDFILVAHPEVLTPEWKGLMAAKLKEGEAPEDLDDEMILAAGKVLTKPTVPGKEVPERLALTRESVQKLSYGLRKKIAMVLLLDQVNPTDARNEQS